MQLFDLQENTWFAREAFKARQTLECPVQREPSMDDTAISISRLVVMKFCLDGLFFRCDFDLEVLQLGEPNVQE
jgi:hypothetical protein